MGQGVPYAPLSQESIYYLGRIEDFRWIDYTRPVGERREIP